MSRWESRFHAHHLAQVASGDGPNAPITQPDLQRYLLSKFPHWTNLRLLRFTQLPGGVSKNTILFDTEDAVNGRQSLVLRAEQPVNLLHFGGSDLAKEFYAIKLLRRAGLPVPEALWLEEDTSLLGVRFLVSRKAEGSNFGGTLGAKERPSPQLLESLMDTFYQMHTLKIEPSDPLAQKSHLGEWLPHKTIRESSQYCVTEYLPTMARRADIKITPQLMRCFRWLEHNVPDGDEAPAVVHLDYAYNNILVLNNKVSAVLDWETAILGDPAGDIVHTQHNLNAHSMSEFLELYLAHTGRRVSRFRLAYARLVRATINNIMGPTAVRGLDVHDNAPLHMGVMAFKYMPIFGAKIDELIEAAEACPR
jgi:aminoglycoside phosphotransferase (APT) family kinase protein